MTDFCLALGESRFRISLGPACAALLPAFTVDARKLEATEKNEAPHHLTIWEDKTSFVLDTGVAEPGEANPRQRFPSAAVAMLSLEYEIERRVIEEARGLVALHGGAVAVADGACLVLGNSEDGKSATTFQLAELGHRFLCEEVTLVDPISWKVESYRQTVSLSADMVAEFEASLPIRGRLYRMLDSAVRYRPPERSSATQPPCAGAPVAWILLPKFSAGAATRLSSLAVEDALPEVLGYAFPPNLDTEILFDRIIGLLERTETLRFVYGDAASARSALAELFPAG